MLYISVNHAILTAALILLPIKVTMYLVAFGD